MPPESSIWRSPASTRPGGSGCSRRKAAGGAAAPSASAPLHERWILGQGSVTREVGMSPGWPRPRDQLRSVYVLGPGDPVTLKFRMRGEDRPSWDDDVL